MIRSLRWLAPAVIAAGLVAQDPPRQIVGRVLDDALRPLDGATVQWLGATADPAARVEWSRATTDPDGRFALPDASPAGGARWIAVEAPRRARYEFPWFEATAAEDLVVPAGVSMLGAVRDDDGRPLEGVEVVATDALADCAPLRTIVAGPGGTARVVATSDARGLFRLDGVLPTAVTLRLSKPGFAPAVRSPIAYGEPLAVELKSTGLARGRVFDADGRPVAAVVELRHTDSTPARSVQADADGRFEIGLVERAPYRLVARARVGGIELQAKQGPFDEARERLVLTLARGGAPDAAQADTAQPVAAPVAGPSLVVTAIASESGRPIPEFEAAVVWQPAGFQLSTDQLWRVARGQLHAAADGSCALPGPVTPRQPNGIVVVRAPGRAWTRVDGAAADTERPTLRVELAPERVVRGVVVDPVDGSGLAGVTVGWSAAATTMIESTTDRLRNAIVLAQTDADGRFELGGLPDERLALFVVGADRPRAEPPPVDFDAVGVATVRFELPRGAVVSGVLRGVDPAARLSVSTRAIAVVPADYATLREPPRRAPLGADGMFAVGGLPAGFHRLELAWPRIPRTGLPPTLVIDAFRIRAGVDRELDCDVSADLPRPVELAVEIVGAPLPRERVVVVAEDEVATRSLSAWASNGVAAMIAPNGSGRLRVVPGRYRLRAFDVATGVEVLRRDGVEIGAAAPSALSLRIELAALVVRVQTEVAADRARLQRIETVVEWPAPTLGVARVVSSSDSGIGLSFDPAVEALTVFVPPRPVRVRAWAGGLVVDEDSKQRNAGPVVEQGLEPVVAERRDVRLTVPPLDDDR